MPEKSFRKRDRKDREGQWDTYGSGCQKKRQFLKLSKEEMNNRSPCCLVRTEMQKVSCRCEVVVGENGFEDNLSPLSFCKTMEIRLFYTGRSAWSHC